MIIPAPSEKWDTKSLTFFKKTIKYEFLFLYIIEIKTNRPTDGIQDFNTSSVLPSSGMMSSPVTTTPPSSSVQYAVFCSSKEARVN